jgi:transposase
MQSPQCVAAEVASLIRERDQLLARVERLEEAGDEMAAYEFLTDRLAEKWIEAKEAKP